MEQLIPKILEADALVFSSPVYMHSISARLKTVFDRMRSKYQTIADKELYYIMTSAEGEPTSMDTALACMRGIADCIPGSKEMRVIYAKGLYHKGEVNSIPLLTQPYPSLSEFILCAIFLQRKRKEARLLVLSLIGGSECDPGEKVI